MGGSRKMNGQLSRPLEGFERADVRERKKQCESGTMHLVAKSSDHLTFGGIEYRLDAQLYNLEWNISRLSQRRRWP